MQCSFSRLAAASNMGGQLGVFITILLRYPPWVDLSCRCLDTASMVTRTAKVSEPAARTLNPAAFAGETFLPCRGPPLSAVPCEVTAGITFI